MASNEVQKELTSLEKQLVEAPKNMRLFSLSMRSLFTENAVGTSSNTAVRFRKLRDETRNDAVVYVKGVLPVVKQCVSDIKGYFEYYQDLTIDEWWENLRYIIEEAKAHKEACEALIAIHEDIITELKKRQDDAKILVSETRDLSAEYEKKAKELQARAETKSSWAIGLMFIPVVNIIASPILGMSAQTDVVNAVAKEMESKIQIAAATTVSNVLVPALTAFVDGLQDIAGFFAVIHQELETFQHKGEKAMDAENPKQIHYYTMKGKAHRMMEGCNSFFAVLPSVRTDLEAIPIEGTDQNYVDRWMESQMAVIKDKCSSQNLIKKLVKAITIGSKKEES